MDSIREQYLEKPLPANPDAEKTILGSILLDNEVIADVIEVLKPEDFYSPLHRRIYAAMLDLFNRSSNIDPILIGEEIKKTGAVESIGGVAAITNLTYGLPFGVKLQDIIALVKEKSITRNFIKVCQKSMAEALAEEEQSSVLIDQHEQAIFNIREKGKLESLVKVNEPLQSAISKLQAMAKFANDPNHLLGLSTGFKDLNEQTQGLQNTDLIVIGARPSMGKTSLSTNICINATDDDPEAVIAYFSLETSREQLVNRMVIQDAKVDAQRYRKGFLVRDEWGKVAASVDRIAQKKIFIDDAPGLTVLEIKARCRKLFKTQKRLDLIVIDHLSCIGSTKQYSSKHLEIGDITKALKEMAKFFNCPVILLAQLSRKVEDRNPPKPVMSDLRESGNIEEDANMVFLLYRAEYYRKKYPKYNISQAEDGICELIIGKNKDGPTGTVKLAFLAEFATFENYAHF